MKTWRLVIFGREVMRTERHDDPDKSMIEAINELIDDSDEDGYGEDPEPLRIAGEEEHLVFTAEDEDEA